MMNPVEGPHELLVEAKDGETLGRCSCGHWERCVDHELVRLTGRSREDALRSSHDLHARGIDSASG